MKNTLIKMINERRKIRIIYNGTERIIEPYYLFSYYYNGFKSLYVAGFCHVRREPRIFKLSRITSRRQLREKWDLEPFPLKNLDLSNFNNGRIEIISGTVYNNDGNISLATTLKNMEYKRDYPKRIKLSKMNRPGMCRSPLEERILSELNSNKKVVEIEVEPYKIKYTYENIERTYIPDLLIYYKDGTMQLVEIKVSGEIPEPQNQAKFDAAVKFAKKNGIDFIIKGIDAYASNYRQTGEFGWSKHNRKLPITDFEPGEFISQNHPSDKKEQLTSLGNNKLKENKLIIGILITILILFLLFYISN